MACIKGAGDGAQRNPRSEQHGMDLSIHDVGVERAGRHILRKMSFRVAPGQFVGILGPSGCGKSTLIEVLSLTDEATEGRVLFDGKDITKQSEEYRKNLRYVPQIDALYPTLTVREHVRDAALLLLPRKTEHEISLQVEAALERVGLLEHQDKPVFQLSGGQRKRVSIAMALPGQPRILILDEPTSGLDPALERRLMLLLRDLAQSGITVICSTHVMENVRLFDRVAVIDKINVVGQQAECGRLLDYLPVEAFLARVHEQNADYARFFEQLEADPGLKFWDKSHAHDGSGMRERISEAVWPIHLAMGPIADSLNNRLLKPCEKKLRRLFSILKFGGLFWNDFTRHAPPLRQVSDVFQRSLRVFLRDRFLVLTTALLPPLLGLLIVLSQQNETNVMPLLFFALVVSLWFGMNNAVRCIVSERRLFVREQWAGLTGSCYVTGKALFYTLLGLCQIAILAATVQCAVPALCREMLCENWGLVGVRDFFVTLFSVYTAGVGLGLLISTRAATENVAVALVPLFLMPQILLSTVAAGNSAENFDHAERILPIYVARTAVETPQSDVPPGWEATKATKLFKAASLFCYTRPALLLLELKVRGHEEQRAHLWETLHLGVLMAATWAAFWLSFCNNNKKWHLTRSA